MPRSTRTPREVKREAPFDNHPEARIEALKAMISDIVQRNTSLTGFKEEPATETKRGRFVWDGGEYE
jgi:hypothetical protein